MTLRDEVRNEYFNWMVDVVSSNRFSKEISFNKLLMYLHNTKFRYIIQKDKNRAIDGIDLRRRFAYEHPDISGTELYLDGPCTVLEMMVALSIRCEETIMDDPKLGNRTGQWFWGMVTSLGLGSMMDDRFDRAYVENVINKFLNREYLPDGRGGLFTVRNCKKDLRSVEIWYQMCWYLDGIV